MALLLVLCLLLSTTWIYWPGISGPELLDDRSSVLVIGDVKSSPELALDYDASLDSLLFRYDASVVIDDASYPAGRC